MLRKLSKKLEETFLKAPDLISRNEITLDRINTWLDIKKKVIAELQDITIAIQAIKISHTQRIIIIKEQSFSQWAVGQLQSS